MIKPDEHLAQSLSSTRRENLPLRNKIFIISNYKCYCCQDNFSHEGYDFKIVFNKFKKKSQILFTNENTSFLQYVTIQNNLINLKEMLFGKGFNKVFFLRSTTGLKFVT